MRTICLSLLFVAAATTAYGDPCGMVPPIYPGGPVPLARVGDQMTYVFYKDGIETFVIRPGFTGKVEDFGMLIPFPTPPALRKVSDDIFPHIGAAIDPPEVVVDLRMRMLSLSGGAKFSRQSGKANALAILEKEEVRVLREEAVGMYEVAVLEAGSPAALKKWMDDHGYQYPQGMDDVCEDYVNDRWCFVAVKTSVGAKSDVDPKAGQRNIVSKLPAGGAFDGHVQAMGFRFKSEELVVPMRLSAFNEGELRNIVYLMTDSPKKIRAIPEEYVVRQISGKQLIANLTQPLPLRIIGGTEKDIPEYRRKSLPNERKPEPHNGAAKDLFASDLQAVAANHLSLAHEEEEKVLLRIGERLGLRGGEIDNLHSQAITESRNKATAGALKLLAGMTLTVVDGDFPREVIASRNLNFAEYQMPTRRNSPVNYNARTKGPQSAPAGVLRTGQLQWNRPQQQIASRRTNSAIAILVTIASGLMLIGLVYLSRTWSRGNQ